MNPSDPEPVGREEMRELSHPREGPVPAQPIEEEKTPKRNKGCGCQRCPFLVGLQAEGRPILTLPRPVHHILHKPSPRLEGPRCQHTGRETTPNSFKKSLKLSRYTRPLSTREAVSASPSEELSQAAKKTQTAELQRRP